MSRLNTLINDGNGYFICSAYDLETFIPSDTAHKISSFIRCHIDGCNACLGHVPNLIKAKDNGFYVQEEI